MRHADIIRGQECLLRARVIYKPSRCSRHSVGNGATVIALSMLGWSYLTPRPPVPGALKPQMRVHSAWAEHDADGISAAMRMST